MTIVLDQNGNPVEAGNVAGELISLRSENAKLKAELEQWQRSVCDQGEVIENLKAELAAAQKDAERYRWLRDGQDCGLHSTITMSLSRCGEKNSTQQSTPQWRRNERSV